MINIAGAKDVTPDPANVSDVPSAPAQPIPSAITLANASYVNPEPAPVTSPPFSNAETVNPEPAPVTLAPLSEAGVELVKWLLVIIFIFVAISVIWIWISESSYSGWLQHPHSNSNGDPSTDLMKEEEAGFREFWLKVFQMVLLNVLLPVLTAILGYTFGSSQSTKS
jgi:hypothetical protein